MSVVLDSVVSARGWRVTALSRVSVWAEAAGGGVVAGGAKRPLALLIGGPGGVQAFGADGAALTQADVEALLPGAWARFSGAG